MEFTEPKDFTPGPKITKLPDYSGHKALTVFCWSRTAEGSPRWGQAERLGALAAEKGYSIVTGGYCGSMEAVSKGARLCIERRRQEAAAHSSTEPLPEVVGVVVSELFPDRATKGNPYLTVMIDSDSMLHRIDQLSRLARYFVILPGTMGTLQEVVSVWMSKILHPKHLVSPIIIAFRDPWEACLRGIAESLSLPPEQIELIVFVDTPEEVMAVVEREEAALSKSSS